MLNKCNFQIARLAAEDENAPPVLTGILVSPDCTRVTDGRLAVTVTSVESPQALLFNEADGVELADYFTPFVLDRESALKVAKSIPKKAGSSDAAHYAVVDATTENNDRAMVSVNDLRRQEVLRAHKIDGSFPNIEAVTPAKEDASFAMRVGPSIFADLAREIEAFCAFHKCGSVELRLYGSGKPIRFDVDGIDQQMTAIMMPQRD